MTRRRLRLPHGGTFISLIGTLCQFLISDMKFRISLRANEHDPETIITYFQGFLKIVTGVITFDGSITFSLILTDLPSESNIPVSVVREFIAISWLLFVVGLGEACMCTSLLNFYVKQIGTERAVPKTRIKWAWVATVISAIIYIPLMGAFTFMSLAVMAFAREIGLTGLVITSIIILLMIYSIVIHSPWISRPIPSASLETPQREKFTKPDTTESDEELQKIVDLAKFNRVG